MEKSRKTWTPPVKNGRHVARFSRAKSVFYGGAFGTAPEALARRRQLELMLDSVGFEREMPSGIQDYRQTEFAPPTEAMLVALVEIDPVRAAAAVLFVFCAAAALFVFCAAAAALFVFCLFAVCFVHSLCLLLGLAADQAGAELRAGGGTGTGTGGQRRRWCRCWCAGPRAVGGRAVPAGRCCCGGGCGGGGGAGGGAGAGCGAAGAGGGAEGGGG